MERIALENNAVLVSTPYDATTPFLDKHTKEILTCVQGEICTRMLIAILCMLIKTRNSNAHRLQNRIKLTYSYNRLFHKIETI